MTDYYKLLSDPKHAWLNDPDSPFRCWESKRYPFIHFEFRRHKRKTYGQGSRLLKVPVAERPCLYKPGDRLSRLGVGIPLRLKPGKERFNFAIERLIEIWHREAAKHNCDHPKPFVRMSDDLLTDLFPLI